MTCETLMLIWRLILAIAAALTIGGAILILHAKYRQIKPAELPTESPSYLVTKWSHAYDQLTLIGKLNGGKLSLRIVESYCQDNGQEYARWMVGQLRRNGLAAPDERDRKRTIKIDLGQLDRLREKARHGVIDGRIEAHPTLPPPIFNLWLTHTSSDKAIKAVKAIEAVTIEQEATQ